MSDYAASNYTKTTATPEQFVSGGEYGGRARSYYDTIATTTGMTAGATISLGVLRPGERFLFGQLKHVAHATGRTIKIGISGDDDKFLAAASIASAGTIDLGGDGFGYKNETGADIEIFGTTAGGALAADAAGLKIAYLVARD